HRLLRALVDRGRAGRGGHRAAWRRWPGAARLVSRPILAVLIAALLAGCSSTHSQPAGAGSTPDAPTHSVPSTSTTPPPSTPTTAPSTPSKPANPPKPPIVQQPIPLPP